MCERIGICLLAMLPILCVGCGPNGPEKAPVSGVVTFQGRPVKHAACNILPTEHCRSENGLRSDR